MYKFFIIILITLISLNAFSQEPKTFGEEEEPVHYFLGFRLIPTYSSAIQFALIYAPNDIIEEITIISAATFVAYATGTTKNDANPKKENFFEEFDIENEDVINDLWKLRYKNYPFKLTEGTLEEGWSVNDSFPSMPSENQLIILEQFGISKISDFSYGDNAFRLLSSIQKEDWITKYKSAY